MALVSGEQGARVLLGSVSGIAHVSDCLAVHKPYFSFSFTHRKFEPLISV